MTDQPLPPRDSRVVPMAPMQNPSFAWPPHLPPSPLTCCECGRPIQNETYRVLRGKRYCDECAVTEG